MLRRERILKSSCFLLIIGIFVAISSTGGAIKSDNENGQRYGYLHKIKKATTEAPCHELRVHRVGNIHFSVTNYGVFGTGFDQIPDPESETGEIAPSCEFPARSGLKYMYLGALWVGGIVNGDTLVSTGFDGSRWIFEMHPASCGEGGEMVKRSNRKNDPAYNPDAISEADYIAVYTDTLTDQAWVDFSPDDIRPHIPIGIEITQTTYSWSYTYAEDFILLDYLIQNIGTSEIKNAFLGVYLDPDVHHVSTADGYDDDICGFRKTHPSPTSCIEAFIEDTINIAWVADADGDPASAVGFDEMSPIAVIGTRVVRTPNPDMKYSFNWWTWFQGQSLGWGPVRIENVQNFGTSGIGIPYGDVNKYLMMKNNEFDYDQLWSAVDFSEQGWLPPNYVIAGNLADGYDPRYLLSFGPFDIDALDSLPITLALVAGDHFHANPNDFKEYFQANNPRLFYDKLNFDDLATNATWAAKMYDNPGVDTDGDGYAGIKTFNPCLDESVWIAGDGEPDFSGPPPPVTPMVRFSTSPGEVNIRWNGYETEHSMDPFTFVNDFEGYRVYIGDEMQLSAFALVTAYDRLNYDSYRLNPGFDPPLWELRDIPRHPDELYSVFGLGDDLNDPIPDFNPEMFSTAAEPLIWYEVGYDDTIQTAYYFRPHGDNRYQFSGAGQIRKVYEDADTSELIWIEELNEWVHAAYEYEFKVAGLMSSLPVYVAVTAIDFGHGPTDLAPLESSPLINAVEVFPIWSNEEIAKRNLKVSVFPNPYKIDAGYGYLESGYEKLTPIAPSVERARQIHFTNLPSQATIRIYSLDGDLVRELKHPCFCHLQEGESMMAWDVISRNTQAVVSGIYLYTVQSEFGTQVGKFVIIK